LVIDLPYGIIGEDYDTKIKDEEIIRFLDLIKLTFEINETNFIIFSNHDQLDTVCNWFKQSNIKFSRNIWSKPYSQNPQFKNGTKYESFVIGIAGSIPNHFTINNQVYNFCSEKNFLKDDEKDVNNGQKPLGFLYFLIKNFSNRSDLILDCCSGTATTAVCCYLLNRDCISFENNQYQFKQAVNRVSKVLEEEDKSTITPKLEDTIPYCLVNSSDLQKLKNLKMQEKNNKRKTSSQENLKNKKKK
jgi:hypothetical protein